MADDEIVVQVEKEAPVADATVVEKAADPVVDLKAQLESLQAQTEIDKRDKIAAQTRAAESERARAAAEREVETTRTEITESRLGTVEQGIAAAQSASDAALAEYVAAQEAGDWKKAGDAQIKIADARAHLNTFNEAKANLEATKVAPRVADETRKAPQGDPVETFLAQRTPATASWLRAHPDEARALALGDTRRGAKLNAAHSDAIAEGFAADSPEYFGHVEKFLGMTKEDAAKKNDANNGAEKPQRRAASAPVAPVQASSGGTSGGVEVRLTRGEAKVATDGTHIWNYDDPSPQKRFKKGDPIGIQELARRKSEMTKLGLYDKTYVEQ